MQKQDSNTEQVEKAEIISAEYAPSKDIDNLSINDAARGDNLPDKYYMSFSFVGTVIVSLLIQLPVFLLLTTTGSLSCSDCSLHLLDSPNKRLGVHQRGKTIGQITEGVQC